MCRPETVSTLGQQVRFVPAIQPAPLPSLTRCDSTRPSMAGSFSLAPVPFTLSGVPSEAETISVTSQCSTKTNHD